VALDLRLFACHPGVVCDRSARPLFWVGQREHAVLADSLPRQGQYDRGNGVTGLRRILSPLVNITATIARTASPWLMLAIRVWLGQAFLAHQIAMLMMGQSMTATLSSGGWAEIFAQIAATGFGGVVQALCPLLLAA